MTAQLGRCPIAPFSSDALLSRELAVSPHTALRTLQEEGAVHQVEDLPWYLVTRFQDCSQVLLNSGDFSSEHREFGPALARIGLTPSPEIHARMLEIGGARAAMFDIVLHRDAPAHTRQRRLLNKALTAKFGQWDAFIAERTSRLLDALPEDRPFDWIDALAAPLPIAVISDILGMPDRDHARVKQWSDHSSAVSGRRAGDQDWLNMATAMAEQRNFFATELKKRLDRPTGDLVSALAAATLQGADAETGDAPLTFDEAVEMLVLVLIGGNETTTQLLGGLAYIVASEPDLLDRIRADAALINPVVEEALRITTPITTMMRFCVNDAEVGGVKIPKGAIVSVCFNQANRDPAMFADPACFDPGRANVRRHLAFSTGIHLCPGAPLARAEARMTLRLLAERFSKLSLSGDSPVRYEMASLAVRGMTGLDLRATRITLG
ncbi:Peroxidase [Sphingobium chlorophenolicum L-1]|uniref:Peroxidase n=1 Tax=Sphingobium chlorophenolicum L-1 TaxID=690566 RepID=F6F318_SPHCR|nr:cytochrome P450 [Sphingobium chlorophenolicum]AEG50830.1 Peroxidase [Sphingobium chlorophenolicum L-1]